MATLQQAVKQPKELKQIAAQIKNVALFKAPYKTGNLRRRLNQANRPANMIKVINGQTKSTISVSLDIAPSGAKYGKYWNDPNVSWQVEKGGNPANINYGEKALEDPSVKKEWDKFIKKFSDDYVKMMVKELKGT